MSPCLLSEIMDCDGNCFPGFIAGMLEDSCCDSDAINFNCQLYNFDNGACGEDTEPPVITVIGSTQAQGNQVLQCSGQFDDPGA